MVTAFEISSFTTKFAQLSSCGFRANLNFSCSEGKILVNLNAELGCADFTAPEPPSAPFSFRHVKPGKVRRRQRRRREQAKKACDSENFIENVATVKNSFEEAPQSKEPYNCRIHDAPVLPNQVEVLSDDSIQFQASESLPPSVQFVVPVSPKEPSIMQKNNSMVVDLKSTHTYVHEGLQSMKLCEFCETEFSTLHDFENHMKCVGFICNNCLDFYSDMKWFPEAESRLVHELTGSRPVSTTTASTT